MNDINNDPNNDPGVQVLNSIYKIWIGVGIVMAGITLAIHYGLIPRVGKKVDTSIKESPIELIVKESLNVENVIGNKTPDKFYMINGKRAYLEVDGKSVEDYFKGKE